MTDQTFGGFAPPTANFSHLPHQLIEAFPLFETKAELMAVLYILRHTWGFHDDDKQITLDEFMNGRKRKDGTRLDSGMGMGKAAIIEGLRRAESHGFICVETDDSDKARIEKRYSLRAIQMYENRTADVRKSHPGGMEIVQRTEKETSRKKQEKEKDIASDDARQKPSTKTTKPKIELPDLKAVVYFKQNYSGRMTQVLIDALVELVTTYTDDTVYDAITTAILGSSKGLNVNYLKGVLKGWQRDGKIKRTIPPPASDAPLPPEQVASPEEIANARVIWQETLDKLNGNRNGHTRTETGREHAHGTT